MNEQMGQDKALSRARLCNYHKRPMQLSQKAYAIITKGLKQASRPAFHMLELKWLLCDTFQSQIACKGAGCCRGADSLPPLSCLFIWVQEES